jgi:hypothetical protein
MSETNRLIGHFPQPAHRRPGKFKDTEPVPVPGLPENSYETNATVTAVEEWFLKLAAASLAAAEVIYPEIPLPPRVEVTEDGIRLADVPAAAQAGAATVMPTVPVNLTGD